MISVQNITKTFTARGHAIEALRSVSFNIAQGEVCGLWGPNGAGKTTLLKILATQLLPDSGFAQVAGNDVLRDPIAVKRSLGYVNGDTLGFYLRLTGEQNLLFFGSLYGVERRRLIHRIADVAEKLRISRFLNLPIQQLSTGTIQKLSITRALLTDAPVLLLDEVSRSLDKESSERIRQLIKDDLSGKTILMVSHNLDELKSVCSRILLLDRGEIRNEHVS